MKRRVRRTASNSERVLRASGLQLLRAIRARVADPNRIPLDLDVSFIPSRSDMNRMDVLQRRRRDA